MIYSEIIHLNSDNKILIEVLNARSIRVTLDATPITIERLSGNRIKVINIWDKPYINLTESNKVFVNIGSKVQTYVIKEIRQIVDNVFLANTESRTKASYFITPMLGESKETFRWDQYFVNTYLSKDEQFAFVKYRFFNVDDYKKFEYVLTRHNLFIKMIDKNHQHVLFQFRIPEVYLKEIPRFLQGQYSKLSESYKQKILQFFHYNRGGELGQILYRTDRRKRQLELKLGVRLSENLELYDKPDLKVEVYDQHGL